MVREIELYEKPLEIREKLEDAYGAEMSSWQSGFLCGLIKKYHPKKIVEVGVAAGGTTAIILNCISELGLDTEVHSVDLNERYYRDKHKETGYLAQKCKTFLQRDISHKMYLGGVLPEYLDEIGSDIDFLILDTVHSMPGEVLDFLACLPKLKDGAIVVLHDIIMNHFHAPESFATKILLSSVVGEKIICSSNDDLYKYPNIGAFRITKDTWKYIENVFLTLTVTWKYIPDSYQLDLYKKCFERYYDTEMCEEFNCAVRMNMESLGRQKAIFREGLYAICELLKVVRVKKNIYIYGCGNYGKKLYNILTKAGIEINGYVISENQTKVDIGTKVDYILDIDCDENTYILGMNQINQNSMCREKIKGEIVCLEERVLKIL